MHIYTPKLTEFLSKNSSKTLDFLSILSKNNDFLSKNSLNLTFSLLLTLLQLLNLLFQAFNLSQKRLLALFVLLDCLSFCQ
jgi:hypothetical protein